VTEMKPQQQNLVRNQAQLYGGQEKQCGIIIQPLSLTTQQKHLKLPQLSFVFFNCTAVKYCQWI